MPSQRNRAGASQSPHRRRESTKHSTTKATAAGATVQCTQDPRVLEAAYRAFERLSRPRYLH